jgi:shikimate dehydrogenase
MMRSLRLGLIGDKIQRSRSPDLHRLAGRLCGLEVTYERLIPPEMGEAFDSVLRSCGERGLRGVNITYPYKERVLEHVVSPSPDLAALGACNTILFEGEALRGFNTDCTGFASAFLHRFGRTPPGIVAMAGAGGVGKAIAFALARLGARELRLCDPDWNRARQLAAALAREAGGMRIEIAEDIAAAAATADGIVNATPLGMDGVGGNAVPGSALPGRRWAFDAVYTPEWTAFLREARAAGAEVMTGFDLFLFQGIDAFRIFSGVEIDPDALWRELTSAPMAVGAGA